MKNFIQLRKLNTQLPTHMREFFEKRSKNVCFDNYFNHKWKVIKADENSGKCLIELKVDENLANINKVIHGGAIATLVDAVSTAALFNTPVRKPGVSVDIHMSYMKPAKLNETILVEGKVVKAGNKMAYLTAEVYIKSEDSFDLKPENLVATGTHTKFIV